MLKLIVGQREWFDNSTEMFVYDGGVEVEFEHSLVSLSKWEAKVKRPFLAPGEMTPEEIGYYIEAMVITDPTPERLLELLTESDLKMINDYINDAQTATTFREESGINKSNQEIISAELIYFWMFSCGIPLEAQYWHLSRLFAQIRVFSVKNSKQKKVNPRTAAQERARLNAERRQTLGTKG